MLLVEAVKQVAVASFVLAVLLVRQSRGCQVMGFTGLTKYNDQKITLPIEPLQTFESVRDDLECAKECTSLVRCSMFAFNEQSLECSLFPAPAFKYNFFPLSAISSPGLRYYAVHTDWCPARKGFFIDRESELCYYQSQDKRTFNNSETACQELSPGSRLLMLKETKYREAIARVMNSNIHLTMDHLFIGGLDLNTGDGIKTYHWIDGTEVVDPFWYPGEPSGDANNQFCLAYAVLKLHDMDCTNQNRYFCAIPK
ncbi:C-type lectin lectoxin-Thr1-like [Haliotis rubra]|uniref:C-type lectin lectoxin-Thr1-like n=1 Tax=Haliotis rubra TaxID=36100 RepID=UPI001EE558A1|nr:C-type lectin lectoxin-Thr1-like [Haliotis rubra]